MKLVTIIFTCALSAPFLMLGMNQDSANTSSNLWRPVQWIDVNPEKTLTINDYLENLDAIQRTIRHIIANIETAVPHSSLKEKALKALHARLIDVRDVSIRARETSPNAYDFDYLIQTLLPAYCNTYRTKTEPALRKLVQDLEKALSPNIDDALAALEGLRLQE